MLSEGRVLRRGLFGLLATAATFGCSGGEGGLLLRDGGLSGQADASIRGDGGSAPTVVLSSDTVRFGAVLVGGPLAEVVVSATPLNGAVLQGVFPGQPFNSSAFSFDVETVLDSAQIRIIFTPTKSGPVASTIVVRALIDGRAEDFFVLLEGQGVDSFFTVRPGSLQFGEVVVGTEETLTLEIENETNDDADFRVQDSFNVEVCGQGSSASFCIEPPTAGFADDPEFRVARGETASLEIRFAPDVSSFFESGGFLLSCGGPECEFAVDLSGTAVEGGLRCDPSTVFFQDVSVGDSGEEMVRCQAVANVDVTLQAARFGGGTSSAFSVVNDVQGVVLTAPDELTPGGTVDIGVRYAPTARGEDLGTLLIAGGGSGEVEIQLQGFALSPEIDVGPQVLDFGIVPFGESRQDGIVVGNAGDDELVISEMIVDADGTGVFSSGNAGATRIPAFQSEFISIAAVPTAVGAVSSRFIIRSNDAANPEVVVSLRVQAE